MSKFFNFLLGLSIVAYLGYVVIESIRILTGYSEKSWSDMQQFYFGALMVVLIVWFSFRQTKKLEEDEEADFQENFASTEETDHPNERLLRLIITAEESTCGKIYSAFQDHPLVHGIFEDSGEWYSNGEAGPEWFTVTLETTESQKEELESALSDWLKEKELQAGNWYWG